MVVEDRPTVPVLINAPIEIITSIGWRIITASKIAIHAKVRGTLLRANVIHKSIGTPMDYMGGHI